MGLASVDLAERLGVGDRHLRRLFLEHLGAPPIAVAQTHRLLSAKRLLDETNLPVSTVALAAGFGSVRRFNHTIRATWHRTPRELRKSRRGLATKGLCFRLRYRPPLDWDALVGFLATRAIPGVEYVEEGIYRRSIVVDGIAGLIELSHSGARSNSGDPASPGRRDCSGSFRACGGSAIWTRTP